MKTNYVVASAALVAVAVLVLFITMFWRQSSLENEIAVLRTTLENRNSSTSAEDGLATTKPEARLASNGSDTNPARRVGRAEPFLPGDEDPVTDARRRLQDLEATLNGQADVLEKLLAEAAKFKEAHQKASMRAWGPEQAAGAPDTMSAGDISTAWAPADPDGGVEWLEAEFENAADLAKIVVRQTNNPGGITKVVAVTDSGAEIPIWAGEDPGKGKELDDTPFTVPGGINARRVKVYVDTSKKAGWEEIDAMQVVGRDGTSQWAKSTKASSTYANGRQLGAVESSLAIPSYNNTLER
jgi:hypothetical protein